MKANKLTPNLEVTDVRDTVNFYQAELGFSLAMAVPETQDSVEQALDKRKQYVYALVKKDEVEIMFQRSDSFKQDVVYAINDAIGASVSFYMEVEGIQNFYHQLKSKDLEVSALKKAWYGMLEFYLQDINGYILGFAEKDD